MTLVDALVVGAGPAGMAAAIRLRELGVPDVLVVERDTSLGGILNQCIHTGFGLEYFRQELTGPEYAQKLRRAFEASGIRTRTNAMVIDLTADRVATVSSREHGIERFRAGAVILATGCRERTRENIEVAGTRPAGVYGAGQAQALVNLRGRRIGERVVIQGSGDIGLIMARRFTVEGYTVVGVFERLPYLSGLIRNKVQCLDAFEIPIGFSSQVVAIEGRGRVEAVRVRRLDADYREIPGTETRHECDTVVFSVGLIQELELARRAGAVLSGPTAAVNSRFETSVPGVFVCGNALHIHDLADGASVEGEAVAAHAADYLRDQARFREACADERPYLDDQVNDTYTEAFFERLRRDGTTVCVVCPRGCIVSPGNVRCPRGDRTFTDPTLGPVTLLTSTVGEGRRRTPVRALDPVPVRDVPAAKRALDALPGVPSGEFTVQAGGRTIRFTTPEGVG